MPKKKQDSSASGSEYPLPKASPVDEDIYSKGEKEELDDEELPLKTPILRKDEDMDEGLDVPGADLDDEDERIGEEDEENNYYSLGGDNHNDLEEDS